MLTIITIIFFETISLLFINFLITYTTIITFFYLDEKYRENIHKKNDQVSEFFNTKKNLWVFDQNSYDSENWFHPKWVNVPEDAIGVDEAGMKNLLKESGLKIKKIMPGNWREFPGTFFQDIFILEKE